MEAFEETFWDMCLKATKFDDENPDIVLLEPYLLRILEFVKEHPEHENKFKEFFIEIAIRNKQLTHWIVLFCMRELRYPEVQKALNDHFDSLGGPCGAPRLMNYVSDVNWVYDDSPWEDADFFNYYWTKEHPGEHWPCAKNS